MADQLVAKGTSKRPEFAALLGMNPLFAGLGEEAIRSIAALCTRRQLDVGEVLFQKGDKGDALYGVRRGRVRIQVILTGLVIAANLIGIAVVELMVNVVFPVPNVFGPDARWITFWNCAR